ncbi:hypothetical protein [Microseira wollei]|uniref:Uncharacterized protein n=1 Tax=Microseira wollei NIES-4236 TaxID=2530354 RepID=A0AAV3XMW2_9CYAN|nr:hypothetical protein [Microseira wollei]GET42420.1 hypothetical protein MiSe_72370 [Microseira wollei NIES-4236]
MDTEDINNLSPEHDGTSASDCQQFDRVREERLRFDAEFLELQDSKSSSGRLMYAFLRRTLKQFCLSNTYTESSWATSRQ